MNALVWTLTIVIGAPLAVAFPVAVVWLFQPATGPGKHQEGEPDETTRATLIFRRLVRQWRRKAAAPAGVAAGAATVLLTPPDGLPVLDHRMLHEVREQWNAWHDGTPPRHDLLSTAELAALHPRGQHPYPERPTRLQRPDGEIVIDERNHVGVYPWPPAEQPHFPPPPERERADATSVDLNRARPYVRQSTWGEKPQLVVEPELARPVIA